MPARVTALTLVLLAVIPAGCDRIEARSLAKEGNTLYRAGRHAEALARFEAAARLDPEFPTTHLHLGYASMALMSASASSPRSDFEKYARKAALGFRRYMDLRPGDERGPRFYLQVLLDAGRYDEALAFLLDQHRRRPGDVQVVASLGAVCSKAGRSEEALRWYEKQASLLPGDAKARYLVGTLCWKRLYQNEAVSGGERIRLADRGIAALRDAVRLRPGYAEALTYVNLLFRERARGQSDPAARDRDMDEARKYHAQAVEAMRGGPRTPPGAGR